eukprot:5762812-Pleurochrysis_carterae.AAC.2
MQHCPSLRAAHHLTALLGGAVDRTCGLWRGGNHCFQSGKIRVRLRACCLASAYLTSLAYSGWPTWLFSLAG